MARRYNPPPNWPPPPEGWEPPKGWRPDPEWGPLPEGWQLWLDDDPDVPSSRFSQMFTASEGSDSQGRPSQVRRFWKPVVGAGVILLIGVGIGAASNSDAGKVKSLNQQLAAAQSDASLAHSQANGEQQDIADLKTQLGAATTLAATAQQKAEQKAQSDYATKLAGVHDRENQVKSREDAVGKREAAVQNAEQGLQATAFDGDGVYLVGRDIQPGTYSSPGPSGDQCYWARESSPNDSDIIDNHLGAGPTVVQVLSSDVALRVDGCQPFKKIG